MRRMRVSQISANIMLQYGRMSNISGIYDVLGVRVAVQLAMRQCKIAL
jgi:hypothetical protein